MSATDPMNLDQLAEEFDVRGELAGRDDARVLLARRKSDEQPVLITVVRTPPGDRGNALSHLAADTRLLPGLKHPHLLPVLEGRWVGTDAFAVVTERPNAPALEELLARREEKFGLPRIGLILRQANAALEWAREHKVVHRTLRLDAIYVEPGSDHVRVAFAAAPLPADGMPGQQEDGVTIARLARAMMTRGPLDPERDSKPLAELRPGLPRRVIQQTNALLGVPVEDGDAASPSPVDVSEYIAAVAMAEEIKRGEVEYDTAIAQMTEEQRVAREQLAAEREAHEADLAEQAKKFEQEKEETARSFAREKEAAEKALEKERTELHRAIAKEREDIRRTLERERDELQKAAASERAALERDRKRLEKDRVALARDRESFERFSARSREQIAAKLGALDSQARLYGQTAELPVADREMPTPVSRDQDWILEAGSEEQLPADDESRGLTSDSVPGRDEPAMETDDDDADDSRSVLPADPAVASGPEPFYALTDPEHQPVRTPWWRRVWNARARRSAGIAAVALVGVVGVSLALNARSDAEPRAIVTDSAAGTIERPVLLRNLTPTTSVDTTTASASAGTAEPGAEPSRPSTPVATSEPVPERAPGTTTDQTVPANLAATPPQVPAPAVQGVTPADTSLRADSATVRGSSTAARTDSATPRTDTIRAVAPIPSILPLPIDTTRPDSLGRGDR